MTGANEMLNVFAVRLCSPSEIQDIRYMGRAQKSVCIYEFHEILPSETRTLLWGISKLLSLISKFVNRFGRNSV